MANNTKYVFGIGADGSGNTFLPPSGTLVQNGWNPADGTQVPQGINMNYMHRQLSLSNDFWHEIPVDLSSAPFQINEAINSVGTTSSYPAESLLFNVTARAGSPTVNELFIVDGDNTVFNDWPIGRAFWVRNSAANRAVFFQMPNIPANAPSIPEAIGGIYKIIMPGQLCKFRMHGQGTTRLPYLVLEYDSNWVGGAPNINIGAAMGNPSLPLTANSINEYYNGHSYCARCQVVGTSAHRGDTGNDIPAQDYTVNVIDGYNVAKNSIVPVLTNKIGTGDSPTDNVISSTVFPGLYNNYPGAGDIVLSGGLWYYFDVGDPTSDGNADLGLTGMIFPFPQTIPVTDATPPQLPPTTDPLTEIFKQPRVVQSTRSIACLSYQQTSGDNDSERVTSAFYGGGTIVGHSPRGGGFNTVVCWVLNFQGSVSPRLPRGQFIDSLYVIYPRPEVADATTNPPTPGYF